MNDGTWRSQALRQRNDIRLLAAEIERLDTALQESDARMMDICRSALKFTIAIRNQNNHDARFFMLELEALAELYSNEIKTRNYSHSNCNCYLQRKDSKDGTC